MKRLILPLFAVLVLCGFRPMPLPHTPAGPVYLTVIDRDGDGALRAYSDGDQRWIAGEKGHRYSVRLRNASAERVLVVVSVDGLNAITGQVAAPGQTGYVLNPWQTADISGWRKSSEEVAQFVFTTPGRSYAARTGRPDNIGVIGMAVFTEAGAIARDLSPAVERRRSLAGGPAAPAAPPAPAAAESAMADSATRSAAAAPAQRLGTGHGARETSRVRDTAFERASSTPVQQVELRYDSAQNLRARGILPAPTPRPDSAPRAFPSQYVPDPPRDSRLR
ncbi:hypothetical protein [Stenotrophomonas sp.]|uniref:hypothetical protein n=1 Tax=Stenotrophomonas sp. TaxID=69392 RepID=UPI002FC74EF4